MFLCVGDLNVNAARGQRIAASIKGDADPRCRTHALHLAGGLNRSARDGEGLIRNRNYFPVGSRGNCRVVANRDLLIARATAVGEKPKGNPAIVGYVHKRC